MKIAKNVQQTGNVYHVTKHYVMGALKNPRATVWNVKEKGEKLMQLGYTDALTGDKWIGDAIHRDNEFLCVNKREGYFHIYNTLTGKPFFKTKFTTKDMAIQIGQMLHKHYGEYFPIWLTREWSNVDIPLMFQYTIPDGEELCRLIQAMDKNEITAEISQFSRFI